MTEEAAVMMRKIRAHPEELGHQIGFSDLTPLHGEWIREMVWGTEDYTLQAHRGSYKSSCLVIDIFGKASIRIGCLYESFFVIVSIRCDFFLTVFAFF